MYLAITALENNDTLDTSVRIEKTMSVRYIRLSIYKHDSPDGTLTVTFKDGATTIGTTTLDLTELASAVGDYYHGFVRLDMGEAGMRVNVDPTTTYKELNVEISLSGHTNGTSYIALNKPFEGQWVDQYGTILNESDQTDEQLTHFAPYGIELYTV